MLYGHHGAGADPQCVACGTSSRMKCIWLNDAEFSFLRYQPWQCLRCAVNHSFEAAHPGGPAPRRNLCIWFTRVTRLKANYTELQCKMLAGAEGQPPTPSLAPQQYLRTCYCRVRTTSAHYCHERTSSGLHCRERSTSEHFCHDCSTLVNY